MLFAQHEGLEWDGEQGLFSNKDIKIDVAIEDIDQKALYLVQCKFFEYQSNPNILVEEVSDFFNRHEALLKHEWVQEFASDELLDYIGDYERRLDDGWTIQFYFASTGMASAQIKALTEEIEATAAREYPGVSMHLLDFRALKEYYVEAQSLEQQIPELVTLDLPRGRFVYAKRPRPTIVAVVKANSLVNLYRKEREGLFAYNIRSFLGRKGLNKDIVKTAIDDPENFFYYNNGVSAICTHIDLEEATGKLQAHKLQIINGAQTIGSLKSVRNL